MVKKFFSKIKNPLLEIFPTNEEALVPTLSLEKNMIITDCSGVFRNHYSKNFKIGLKKVYKVLDFEEGQYLQINAVVQIIGLLQMQEIFSEQQKIFGLKVNNESSARKFIITAYFDRKYLDKYGKDQKNLYKNFQTHPISWNTGMQNLFTVNVEFLKKFIPATEVKNLEFKVK